MDRPRSGGLSSFHMDTSFLLNRKVRVFRNKFKHFGIELLLSLYEDIYRVEGYYAKFTIDDVDYLVDELEISEEQLFEALNHLNDRNFFTIVPLDGSKDDKEIGKDSLPLIITGRSVQEEYNATLKQFRNSREVDANIWMLDPGETTDRIRLSSSLTFPGLKPLNDQNYALYCKSVQDCSNIAQDCNNSAAKMQPSANESDITDIEEQSCSNVAAEMQPNADESLNPQESVQSCSNNAQGSSNNVQKCAEMQEEKEKEKEKENILIPPISPKAEGDEEPQGLKAKGGGGKERKSGKKRKPPRDRPDGNSGVAISDFDNKKAYGQFDNVWMTDREVELLGEKCPGYGQDVIEQLSSYKASKGKGYKSDYAAMNSWVIKRVDEDRSRKPNGKQKRPSQPTSQDRIDSLDRYEESIYKNFRENVEAVSGQESCGMEGFFETVGKVGDPTVAV